jgi:probable blue pigment (indigoidine) exporter
MRSPLRRAPRGAADASLSRRHLVLLGALAVAYAACYSAIKAGSYYAPPLRFAGLRAVGGGAALLALVAVRRQSVIPSRDQWIGIASLAVIGTVIGYGAMFMSPGRTGAGLSSVLGNTGPLLTVVLAALFLTEPLTRRKLVALGLGTIGIFMVAHPAIVDPSTPGALGALFPLGAAAALAGSSVLLKVLRVGKALVLVVAWQLLLGGAVLLVLSLALEPEAAIVWTQQFFGVLLFLTLVGTAFALVAWYWLVQRHDVGLISIFLMVLIPVLGLGLAWIFFGEPVRLITAAGAALALAGAVLAAGGDVGSVRRLPEREA